MPTPYYFNMATVANFTDSTNPNAAPQTYTVHLTLIPHKVKKDFLAIYTDTTIEPSGDLIANGVYKFGAWNGLSLGSVSITWDGDSSPTVYTNVAYNLHS